MRVLITRPEGDAHETADRLAHMGHQAVIAPLLVVAFKETSPPPLADVQALLITSANGIRAFARLTARRDVTIAAVGPQSAQAAKDLGFSDVRCADGDASDLGQRVKVWFRPDAGALLHPTASNGDGALAASLRHSGFDVRTSELYDVRARQGLPLELAAALQDHSIDACLFFSPRSGRIFCKAVAKDGLEARCEKLVAICISAATAQALTLKFREIRIAVRPNQEALLACLG